MEEWGAVRMATPFGQIYIARTAGDYAYLKRRPREDGESRVVFTLEEFAQLFEDCEEKNLTSEERLCFFAEIRAVKAELQGTFEKIGRPEEFEEGDLIDLAVHKKESDLRSAREAEALRKKGLKTDNGRKESEDRSSSGRGDKADNARDLGFAY